MPYVVGSWSFTVNGNYVCSYQTKTFQQYIVDALQATYGSGATDAQNASDAYNSIMLLRGSDAETSSDNLALRDAEYLLRGYRGALLTVLNQTQGLSDSLINDLYDAGGPYGLLLYNGLKLLKGSTIAGPGQLPATPAGGAAANLTGWLLGSLGLSIQQVVQTIQAPNFQFSAPKSPSSDSNAPTLPDLQFDVSILQHPERIEGFYISVPQAGSTSWFDPVVAKGYAWSVSGNRFASLQLSTQWSSSLTDIKVSFLTFSYPLNADGRFDFLSVAPGGVDSFLITGTPISTSTPHLSIGFTWLSQGETLLSSASGDFDPMSAGGGIPIANAGPNETAQVGNLVTLDGSASSDPTGQLPLTYAWSFVSKPAGSAVTLSNPAIVNPTFTPDALGNYVIQLVVTDAVGLSSVPATVTVSTLAAPPVADAGPDQAITVIGTVVHLNGSQSYSPGGLPITYQWSFVSKPAGSNAHFGWSYHCNTQFCSGYPWRL